MLKCHKNSAATLFLVKLINIITIYIYNYVIIIYLKIKYASAIRKKSQSFKSLRASSYTREKLNSAIAPIRNKELSHYEASKMYGIPVSTLNDHVNENYGLKSQTLGRPPAIPRELENKLAHCLKILEKWGWGLLRVEIMDLICEFIKARRFDETTTNDATLCHMCR